MNGRWGRRLQSWILPVLLFAGWEGATRLGAFPANLLPAPSSVVISLYRMARSGVLLAHVLVSTARVFGGFALGGAIALILGTLVGLSSTAERWLDPTLQAFRSIPSLAWVPLLLLWMGIGEAPKLTLIAIGGFFPTYMGTVAGIRGVDRKLVEVGHIYGLSHVALARRIILPGAMPSVLTGLRTGLGLAWLYLVAAELIAASKGLGFMLSDGRELSRADLILGAVLLLALLGKLTDGLIKWLEDRLLRWRDAFTGEGEGASAAAGVGAVAATVDDTAGHRVLGVKP